MLVITGILVISGSLSIIIPELEPKVSFVIPGYVKPGLYYGNLDNRTTRNAEWLVISLLLTSDSVKPPTLTVKPSSTVSL